MRSLTKLTTEQELNEVLKNRKSQNFSVLYYSTWCKWCDRVLGRAEEWKNEEGHETVYLVNSWDLPESFASFSITSSPSLVHLVNKKVRVDVEYPKVYSFFSTPSPQETT